MALIRPSRPFAGRALSAVTPLRGSRGPRVRALQPRAAPSRFRLAATARRTPGGVCRPFSRCSTRVRSSASSARRRSAAR
ncbi:hypothetical protein, partial [Streptomonospora nanhaiensis]|uniref:hypothetical protein n=1 Tax=Streptomonospora nanhaiensis TaxID=1323731 RepID=UPI0036D83259